MALPHVRAGLHIRTGPELRPRIFVNEHSLVNAEDELERAK